MEQNTVEFTAVLADDEYSVLEGVKTAIDWESLGIRIVALASNGHEALDAIIKYKPDLAIIDIRMPDLTGIEVLGRSRNAGISTDFIILSGYDDFSYAKEAMRYGAKAYLLKPLNSTELTDEICRIFMERTSQSRHSTRRLYQEQFNFNFFNNLIDGKILESSIISQMLCDTDLPLSDSSCYVCAFIFEETLSSGTASFSPDPVLKQLNQEFAGEKHILWKHDSKQLIGIFNTSSLIPFHVALRCLEALKNKELPLPFIGVGDTVSGLMECSYSYNRALTALTYQLYDSSSHIFTYETICTIPPKTRLSDIDCLPLFQYIVKKDREGIKTYCNEFIDSLLYVPMPPPNYVYSLCYALFHQVQQEFSNFSHGEISEIATARDLYRFKQLSQIRQWLSDSFCQLSEFIDAVYGYASSKYAQVQENASRADDPIICTAKEFIHRNITNHIKIEDIAREVHLSPSYFAIYFKNKTNVNLRDYLLTEKMEYARRVLTNPSASISDVAYEVGYGDYRSFSRAFKNVHGITPSDFQAKYKS